MLNDPFNLERFVSAQEHMFQTALSELRRGRKTSHWMWFIFPQVDGLGSSPTARKYAIKSLQEAKEYLAHCVLGPRLIDCCRALLATPSRSAAEVMGYPDDLKLRSSMTLFSLAAENQPEFRGVLMKFFDDRPDKRTLELLGVQERS